MGNPHFVRRAFPDVNYSSRYHISSIPCETYSVDQEAIHHKYHQYWLLSSSSSHRLIKSSQSRPEFATHDHMAVSCPHGTKFKTIIHFRLHGICARNILHWSSWSTLSTHNLWLWLLIIAATVTAIVTIRSFGKSDGSESFIIGIGIKRLKYLLLQVSRKSDNGQQNPQFLYLSNHPASNPLQNFLYNWLQVRAIILVPLVVFGVTVMDTSKMAVRNWRMQLI